LNDIQESLRINKNATQEVSNECNGKKLDLCNRTSGFVVGFESGLKMRKLREMDFLVKTFAV